MSGNQFTNNTPEIEEKSNKKIKFSELLTLLKLLKPYKLNFYLGLVFLFFSSITLLSFPFFTGKLVDAATYKSIGIFSQINTIAYSLLAVVVLQSIFSFSRIYFFSKVSESVTRDIRENLFAKMVRFPISYFDKNRLGELNSRLNNDVTLLHDIFTLNLAEFLRGAATLLIGIVILFFTSIQLSFFMLSTFPIMVFFAIFFGKLIKKLSKNTQEKLAESQVISEESLQSIYAVKAFTNEGFETKRYNHVLKQLFATALKGATLRSGFVSLIIFTLFGGIVGVLWYGSFLVEQKLLSIGELTSFILYTGFIGASAAGLGETYASFQKAFGASERINDILNADSEPISPYKTKLFNGNIELKNLSFSYPTRKEIEVLQNINIKIEAGQTIALVGTSGSGKSTVASLLLNFYKPNSGEILFDFKSCSNFTLEDIRTNIGYVPQETILFGGTIQENIAYGKPHASEKEIWAAAQKAYASSFIESFPEGMQTVVGERGIKLSGGQKQRIAIARAILKNPSILILDEATSALDAESEYWVQMALDQLMENRTTIIISHRLASIKKSDIIFVIEKGNIVEQGSHEYLSNISNGVYKNLFDKQNISLVLV